MSSATSQPSGDEVVHFGGRPFSRWCLQRGIGCVPVDEEEEQRMDELNRIAQQVFGKVVLPDFPLVNEREPKVLDCGFGNGAWIDSLLSLHKDCEVTGIDVFLGRETEIDTESRNQDNNIQLERKKQGYTKLRWNLNVSLRADDSPLQVETFGLINSRFLAEGVDQARWPSYLRELRQLLKPGGWIQLMDLDLCIQSYNGLLPDESCIRKWWNVFQEAMIRLDKNPRISRNLRRLLEEQGFDNVGGKFVDLPIGEWNRDMIPLGRNVRDNLWKTIQSLSLWPLNCRPGGAAPLVTEEQYRLLLRGIHDEIHRDDFKLYYKVYVAWGQRSGQIRRT